MRGRKKRGGEKRAGRHRERGKSERGRKTRGRIGERGERRREEQGRRGKQFTMVIQSLNGFAVLYETELLFHSASYFVSRAQCVSLDPKNIGGVGLWSGTEITRTLVGLVWGLGPRLRER